jgi:predicted nucleic-acid-binding protein
VIGLDSTVLLRFYIEDESDAEAKRQRKAAAKLFAEGSVLFVAKSALLECEWVMRAVYGYSAEQVMSAFHHLLELPQVRVEDPESVDSAVRSYGEGLDFADALHLATCGSCVSFATFDDRQFARRATKAGISPPCFVPRA